MLVLVGLVGLVGLGRPATAAAADVAYPQTLEGDLTYTVSWPTYQSSTGATVSAAHTTITLTKGVFTYDPANSSRGLPNYDLRYVYTSGTVTMTPYTYTISDSNCTTKVSVTQTGQPQPGSGAIGGTDAIMIAPSIANPGTISLGIPEDTNIQDTSGGNCGSDTQGQASFYATTGTFDPTAATLSFAGSVQGGDGGHTTETMTGTLTGACEQVTNQPPPGGGGFMVVSGQFNKTSTQWTSCDGAAVRVNGLDIIPGDAKTSVVFDSKAGTVTSTGPVTIPAGSSGPLFSGTLNQPLASTWNFTPPRNLIGLLPVSRNMLVTLSTDNGGSAQANLIMGFGFFPDEIGGDVASLVKKWDNALQVEMNWNQQQGFAGASARISQLLLGPVQTLLQWRFQLQQLTLTYKPGNGHDTWTAEAKLGSIPNDQTVNLFGVASGTDQFTTSVSITDALFSGATFSIKLGTPLPLGTTGLQLQSMGGSFNADQANDSFSASAAIGLIGGPKVKILGSSLYAIGINGTATIGWGKDCGTTGQPTVASPGAGYFSLSGDISFYNQLKLISGGACAGQHLVSFGGRTLPEAGILRSFLPQFEMSGFIQGTKYFQGTGTARLLPVVPGLATGDGQVVATNTGISVCAKVTANRALKSFFPDAQLGIYYPWGAPSVQILPGCQAVPLALGTGAHAAAAAGRTRVHVGGGTGRLILAVTGQRHPPAVTISGPRGLRIRVPAGLRRAQSSRRWAVFTAGKAPTTYVILRAPAAGAYTITGGRVSAWRLLGAPQVRARLIRHRSTTGLSYAVGGLAGRRLEILVRGADSERVIATLSRARGTFTLPAGSGRQQVLYEIVSGGTAERPRSIGAY